MLAASGSCLAVARRRWLGGAGAMQQILETHVRAHLAEFAEPEFRL
jgi:hypothetical protein